MHANDGSGLSKLPEISSECWDLQYIAGVLYVASTDGLYAVSGFKTQLLLPGETILHLQKGNLSNKLYALGENGGWVFGANLQPELVKEIPPLATSIYEAGVKVAFAGTYQNGLWQANAASSEQASLQDGRIQLRSFNTQLYAQSKEQVFVWNVQQKLWEASEMGSDLFLHCQNQEVNFGSDFLVLLPDGIKQVVQLKTKDISVLHVLNGAPVAYAQKGEKYWLAYANQIFLVEEEALAAKDFVAQINLLAYGKSKLGFAGYYLDDKENLAPKQELVPEISNEDLPVKIYFGTGSLIGGDQQYFSYKIGGLQNEWSAWQGQSFVELQGLSGGNYTLFVKGKDAMGRASKEASFKFYIKAPWYLSGAAYLVYLLILFLVVYLIVFLNQKRLITKNKLLEEKVSERTKELFEEKAKSDELLLNILPLEVADELKRTGHLEARQFDDITVLFTDFVGFTTISEKLTPKELVEEIHYCFKAFDEIIGANKLEKIKTIGDAYMAVCGMPNKDAKHALRVVEAAKQINQFIGQYQTERRQSGKPYFEIRMGINSGPVIAGIVGVKKYAYDIWGDTVNTAARMEQNCEPGKINISGTTHELIKDQVKCSYRGKIEAKNKGRIDMYYIVG
jgi:class 3 adenylate cyclase